MSARLEAALAELAAAIRAEVEAARTDGPVALLSIDEAARRAGVGRTMIYALVARGELRSLKVGRRRLVPADAIEELVARGGAP